MIKRICGIDDGGKTVLLVASVASMIDQFTIPNIKLLLSLGYDVDVAANFRNGNTCTDKRIRQLLHLMELFTVDCYQIDFVRRAVNIPAHIKACRQLDDVVRGAAVPINRSRHHKITRQNRYIFVHSHSPVGGVIGRFTAKRYHIKTIYTAHGFHFYDGAPIKNWLFFYPIERELSRITDVLITINKEDYKRARKEFHAKKTVYIPGIGVDVKKFAQAVTDRDKKRAELGAKRGDILLLSIGELNKNKNHKAVIQALAAMESDISCRFHYFIAGKGGLHDELEKLAGKLGVKLHLLGFRDDIPQLLKAVDVFILPSIREGLNVGLMEAMASGLPCIVSDIRGNRDLIKNRRFQTIYDLAAILETIVLDKSDWAGSGAENYERVKRFDSCQVMKQLAAIYK